jgi:hypothetical protein
VPSPRPPNVFPPRERRWPWAALAISLAVHLLVLLVRIGPWLPPPAKPVLRNVVLVPLGTEGPRAVDMMFQVPRPSAGAARRRPPTAGVSALPLPETGPAPEREPEPDTASVAIETPPDTVGPIGPARGRGRARLGPAQGEGKLWVRPLPLPPQDLARALTGRTHAELVDSAVTAIVQVYIDSVLSAEPANTPLPSWTTRVGESQVGFDSRWIYLGPIKIPTALVAALLPFSGGSAETSDFTKFRMLQQMREDVQVAARRAQTVQDFKRAIRELRAQREREREFARNQRTAPTKKPTTDSTESKP